MEVTRQSEPLAYPADWYRQSEVANTLTHAAGTVLAVVGTFFLVSRSIGYGSLLFAACLVYGVSLTGVFLCSTLSHWIVEEPHRTRFRRLDQGFIYLLIVATYTPFSIVYLRETRWWIILAAMWAIAIAGFASKVVHSHRVNRVSILSYLILGWLPALGGWPSGADIPVEAVLGVLGGGVVYTIGTWFLVNDRRRWYFHACWHVFVMAAAAIHFFTTLGLVIPVRSTGS
jgi:hemolysin III